MKSLLKLFPFLTGPLRSYFNYFFGEKELRFLVKFLKPHKSRFTFIDVGANYGIYTFLFGTKSQFTFAIEPINECLKYLSKGYIKKNIAFIEKVASNNNEEKILNIPIENDKKIYGRSSIDKNFKESIKVESKSFKLDDLIEDIRILNSELIFIKIDVEGHENQVIEGSSKLLMEKKVVLVIEIEKRHNENYLNLIKRLNKSGFTPFYVNKNKLSKINNTNEFEEIMDSNINFLFKNY